MESHRSGSGTHRDHRPGSLCTSTVSDGVRPLSRNEITDDAGQALIDSPHLSNLTLLYLSDTYLSEVMRKALQERFEDQDTEILFQEDL